MAISLKSVAKKVGSAVKKGVSNSIYGVAAKTVANAVSKIGTAASKTPQSASAVSSKIDFSKIGQSQNNFGVPALSTKTGGVTTSTGQPKQYTANTPGGLKVAAANISPSTNYSALGTVAKSGSSSSRSVQTNVGNTSTSSLSRTGAINSPVSYSNTSATSAGSTLGVSTGSSPLTSQAGSISSKLGYQPTATDFSNTALSYTTQAGLTNPDGTPKVVADTTVSDAEKRYQDLLTNLQNVTEAKPERMDVNEIRKQAGQIDAQREYDAISNRIGAISAKAQADLLQLRGTAQQEGVTEAVYGGQQAQIERETAIKLMPLTAQLEVAKGNLDSAKQIVADFMQSETNYQNRLYQYQKEQRDLVKEYASNEQKLALDAKNKADDRQYKLESEFRARQHELIDRAIDTRQGELIEKLKSATNYDELDGYAARLNPSVDTQYKNMQIAKMQAEINAAGSGASADDLMAYASQYSDTGKLPSPSELKLAGLNVGQVTSYAKQMPKPNGAVVSTNTGTKSSALSPTQEEGIVALSEIVNQTLPSLKDRYSKIDSGLKGRVGAAVFTTQDRQDYRTFRQEFLSKLLVARSGAAVTEQEYARYAAMVPSELGDALNIIPFYSKGGRTLSSLETSMKQSLDNKLSSQQLSIYGYSKVPVLGEMRTVGEVLDIEGVEYKVLPDGTLTDII